MNQYFVAVDLGQERDPTAIAVAERAELRGEWDAAQFAYRKVVELRLRLLERVPLGTPYPEVARRVVEVTEARAMAAGSRHLVLDATGVGRPLVDLVREARPPARVMPVVVTGGERESRNGEYYNVPKKDLIAGLQVRFQQGTLRIPRGLACGAEFLEELQDMEVRVTRSGREQYGAWRTGSHDDLVFAVALACWAANVVRPVKEDRWWFNRREAEMAEVFRKVMGEGGDGSR